jgi:hypothetical protein
MPRVHHTPAQWRPCRKQHTREMPVRPRLVYITQQQDLRHGVTHIIRQVLTAWLCVALEHAGTFSSSDKVLHISNNAPLQFLTLMVGLWFCCCCCCAAQMPCTDIV